MPSNDYHMVTRWRVPGSVEEVYDLIHDLPALPRWWPSVYLDVAQIDPGDASGIGKTAQLHTRGWLPYQLHWQSRIVETKPPHGFTLAATGDFVGRGIWQFEQDGGSVDVTFDWRLRVERPGVRELSFLLKPVFEANHRWAMARGEESLILELARRRARTDEERRSIPAPPTPTRVAPLVAGLALGTAAALLTWCLIKRRGTRGEERGRGASD